MSREILQRMSERSPQPPPERRLSQDYRHEYDGYYDSGGVCRIQIWEAAGQPPVIVATELEENNNTSVTNMCEYIAAEVISMHFPSRYEHDEPVIWIERYPRTEEEKRRGIPEYALVSFDSYTPRVVRWARQERIKIGQPTWKHIEKTDVEKLIEGSRG